MKEITLTIDGKEITGLKSIEFKSEDIPSDEIKFTIHRQLITPEFRKRYFIRPDASHVIGVSLDYKKDRYDANPKEINPSELRESLNEMKSALIEAIKQYNYTSK